MTHIFGILESSATQQYQDVAPNQVFYFHRDIYSLWLNLSLSYYGCLSTLAESNLENRSIIVKPKPGGQGTTNSIFENIFILLKIRRLVLKGLKLFLS
jgi:hypothetical protein